MRIQESQRECFSSILMDEIPSDINGSGGMSLVTSVFAGDEIDPTLIEKHNELLDSNSSKIKNDELAVVPNEEKVTEPLQELDIWNELKTRYHNDENPFDIPEEIISGKNKEGVALTAKERADILTEKILSSVKPESVKDDDDFISEYKLEKKSQGENFKINDFIQQKTMMDQILKLDPDTFLSNYYSSQKNEDGTQKYTQEEVNEHISKMNSIDKEEKAGQLKSQAIEYNNKFRQERIQQREQEYKNEYAKWEDSRKEAINQTYDELRNIKDIGGIPFGEAEMKEFNPVFEHLTSLNPKTGNTFINEYMQSNNTQLYKIAYLAHMIDSGGMNNFLTGLKEDVKEKVLNKTGIRPNISMQNLSNEIKETKSSDFY